MTFALPVFFLLLLLVPLILWRRYGRSARPVMAYSDIGLLRKLPVSWRVKAQTLLPILYAVGLIALIVAMARPRIGIEHSQVNADAIDIVLVVDLSTSMRAEDLGSSQNLHINRLSAAKEVIRKFVEDRPYDRIGTVAFASLPYTVSPLTLDHGWLMKRLDDLQIGMLEDGTAIGDALASAVNRLRESKAKSKIVILLTDGVNNCGRLSPVNAAEAAKALGIKVYAVAAGSLGLVRVPVRDPFGGVQYLQQQSEVDEATLQEISKITDGIYFRAKDLSQLRRIYEEIDRMEKTEVAVESFTRYRELFAPFLVLALVCLIVEKLLALTVLRRLP